MPNFDFDSQNYRQEGRRLDTKERESFLRLEHIMVVSLGLRKVVPYLGSFKECCKHSYLNKNEDKVKMSVLGILLGFSKTRSLLNSDG